jgi:hypothetical protein
MANLFDACPRNVNINDDDISVNEKSVVSIHKIEYDLYDILFHMFVCRHLQVVEVDHDSIDSDKF